MDSAPATSPDGPAAAVGTAVVTGEAAFSARLGRRAAPVVRTALAASGMRGPGRLASTFSRFNDRLGLSQTSRWTLEASADPSPDASVRPPISYWPWDADAPVAGADDGFVQRSANPSAAQPARAAVPDDEPDDLVSTGNPRLDALRRMLDKQKKPRPAVARPVDRTARSVAAATPTRPVRRGLPQVLHRRGTAVRRAQPGDMARRLRPAPVDPRAVGQRPAAGAVPTNLPAAAAQVRSAESADRGTDAPPRQVGERRRPNAEAARPARPTGARPPQPASTAATHPTTSPVVAAGPRRPVDLAAAARQLPPTPQPRHAAPADGGDGAGAGAGATSGARPADDHRAPASPSPRAPAGPAASDRAPHRASPAAPSTLQAAAPAAGATIRRTTSDAPRGARVETTPRAAAPAPEADGTIQARTPVTAADARATTTPIRPTSPAPSGQDRVAERRSSGDSTSAATPPWATEPALAERRAAPDPGATEARSAPHGLDTGAPRPPAASAPATPLGHGSADGRGPSATPATDGPGALRTATATTTTTTTTTTTVADAGARPGSDTTRPAAGRPAVAEPIRRAPTADPSRGAGTPAIPEPTPTQRADRARAVPGAVSPSDMTGGAARTLGDPDGAQVVSRATGSDWPMQRSLVDAPSQVDLSARTRTPVGPPAADPAARRPPSAPGFDAVGRPAPPLAPRLRAVDDGERAASPDPTVGAPSARYRPTWQGDAPGGEPRPTTARPQQPTSPDAAPTAIASAPNVAPARNALSPSRASSAPNVASSATASSATGAPSSPNAVSSASSPSPASAAPLPGDQAAILRRALVGDAAVRPATAFAADVATDSRPRAAPVTPRSAPPGADRVTSRPESSPLRRMGADPVTSRSEPFPGSDGRPQAAARADTDVVTAATTTPTNTEPLRPAPPAVRRTAGDHGVDGRPWDRAAQDDAGIDTGGYSPADAPARRFESVLRRAPAAPAPLPVQWRPLASAIAGERRVRVSTNAASRTALQAAGKRAATTGDVIHLARPLSGPADAAVLAHELTHVASPSPAARFFDDDRDSPEERRAEMIADVIRRSPVLPRAGAGARAATADLPVPRASRSTLPGARARRPDAAGASPSVTADDLVQRLTGDRSTPNGAGTIRRWGSAKPSSRTSRSSNTIGGGREQAPTTTTANDGTVDDSTSAPTSTDLRTRGWPMMTNGVDSSTLRDLTDWIVEQVEERVIRELERRGGRYRGEF